MYMTSFKKGLAPEFRRTSRHSMQRSNAQIITSTPSDLLYDFQNNKVQAEWGGKRPFMYRTFRTTQARTKPPADQAPPCPNRLKWWRLPNQKWNMKNFTHKSYVMADRPPNSILQLALSAESRRTDRINERQQPGGVHHDRLPLPMTMRPRQVKGSAKPAPFVVEVMPDNSNSKRHIQRHHTVPTKGSYEQGTIVAADRGRSFGWFMKANSWLAVGRAKRHGRLEISPSPPLSTHAFHTKIIPSHPRNHREAKNGDSLPATCIAS